ncbi:hypothetical protein GKZ28_25535 [Clostridium chromiireducens]|uniref:Helicase superfamily 3 single-stranded DNA/RNA virus domain-containing protein n=1 Tax=Clostridium chromiireducens TaxID=225345 RepID=A0A964RSY4_9CLOT|nr:hypothetical protein [Clostridium chromiireducens]MVX67018.1 hypothetical protein [Clostridium chromiireducens]
MKGRAWLATIHITNMEKAGLTKEEYESPEKLADYFTTTWNESGKNRSSGIAVCVNEKGRYHAHMALYGNTTTLANVSNILFDSHIEPQLGGKKELTAYLRKDGKYAEKGEQALFTKDLDSIQDIQGGRTDLEQIEEYLNQGHSPSEIMGLDFKYRKYEKMIKSAFVDKRIKETPLIKETHNEWHVGDSGSGKTYYYYQLCEKYSPEKIYMATDFENGGFDFYIEQGAPPILFLDEFKGNMRYSQLLIILDKYSRTQTHCRYANTYNLWTTCIITSIFPPEKVYVSMVDSYKKDIDKIDQLIRRLDVIVYHYKTEAGEYKSYSIPANEYMNYDDLKQRALSDKDGLVIEDNMEEIPFKD